MVRGRRMEPALLYLVVYFDSDGEHSFEVCSTPQLAVQRALHFFDKVEIEDRSPAHLTDDTPEDHGLGGPGCVWFGRAKHLDGHAVIYRVTVDGGHVGSGDYPTRGSPETRERRRRRGQFTTGGGRRGDQ